MGGVLKDEGCAYKFFSEICIRFLNFASAIVWLHLKNIRPMQQTTSIFSEKISPANDGLFVLDGLFVHEGLYVYVQLTYKKAWIF